MFELFSCLEFLVLATLGATVVLLFIQVITWWQNLNFKRKLNERLGYLRLRIAETVEHKVTWKKKELPAGLIARLRKAIACRDALASHMAPTAQTAAQLDRAIACADCAAEGVISCKNCSCVPGAELPEALEGFEMAYGSLPGVMEVSEGKSCIRVVVRDRKTFEQMPRQFACQRVQAEMFIDSAWGAQGS